jgi:o-succinylbenzoate synthase
MMNMKITGVKIKRVKKKLIKPFKIAAGVSYYSNQIIVKVETDEGIYGLGAAGPSPRVTGETIETCMEMIKYFGEQLEGQNPLDIEMCNFIMNKVGRNTSAKAAIDIALHDILGKKAGLPLYKLLGGFGNTVESDITISVDEPAVMVEDAKKLVAKGIKILKVKVGLGMENDIERIRKIREAVGDDIIIRLDANQGWTVKEAIEGINRLQEFGIESVEQPVMNWDYNGLKEIRNNITVPLMADESIHTATDAIRLIQMDAVDIINIKLMKSGGLYEAAKINSIAEAAGKKVMIGCMNESTISLAAAAAFAAAHRNVQFADLDSDTYYADNDVVGGYERAEGTMILSEKPGLGVEYDEI